MKYEPWKERPEDSVWKDLKRFIGWPAGTTDTTVPPTFGHILDQLRLKYDIYIAVFPQLYNTGVPNSSGSPLTFRYQGIVEKMSEPGKIDKEYKFSDLLYYVTVRKLISKALEWLLEEEAGGEIPL